MALLRDEVGVRLVCLFWALLPCCLLNQADWGAGVWLLALWDVQRDKAAVQVLSWWHQLSQSCLERSRFIRGLNGASSFSGAWSSLGFIVRWPAVGGLAVGVGCALGGLVGSMGLGSLPLGTSVALVEGPTLPPVTPVPPLGSVLLVVVLFTYKVHKL